MGNHAVIATINRHSPMRFKSSRISGFRVYAVSGTNTVSFGIEVDGADTDGLLGFAVERTDHTENEHYYMYGFKVFPSVIPQPTPEIVVSTYDHPIQSFVWDDFTAKPAHRYTYAFHPLKGAPRNLDRSIRAVTIDVETEPQFDDTQEHDIFFNRGVASSQAYVRKFGNAAPDEEHMPDEALRNEALEWLSRKLDEGILEFIKNARRGDGLRCCFYEFHYAPVVEALKEAVDRGVDVEVIIDAKVNEHTDKEGNFHESFPREINLKTIRDVGFPLRRVTKREAKPNDIQHNKFMVLLKGAAQTPSEVWTGSTNISRGGIFGQTNVGHWVRNKDVAAKFLAYWEVLSSDPGGQADDDDATKRARNAELKRDVEAIQDGPADWESIPAGITTVFSPRRGVDMLNLYATMVDEADKLACITLAFGISKVFKDLLKDNLPSSHLSYFLLEKADKKRKNSATEFVALNSRQNVYKAWGAYLRSPLHRWAREKSTIGLQLNTHVAYIHSKFLLMDPLSTDPKVVTGSANFSEASTNANDENMMIIRGNQRVADIYFTEFNRLFFHYYFRSVVEQTTARLEGEDAPRGRNGARAAPETDTQFLKETSQDWLVKYQPGGFKAKRVAVFINMEGFA